MNHRLVMLWIQYAGWQQPFHVRDRHKEKGGLIRGARDTFVRCSHRHTSFYYVTFELRGANSDEQWRGNYSAQISRERGVHN